MALNIPFFSKPAVVVETLPRTGNPIVDGMTRQQCIDRLRELREQYRAGVSICAKDRQFIAQLRERAGV